MKIETVANPSAWAKALGNLHDLTISRIEIDSDGCCLSFHVDDLNINSENYAGYAQRRCILIFRQVQQLGIDCSLTEPLWVASAEILDGYKAAIFLAGPIGPYEGQYPTIQISFGSLDIIDVLA